MSDTYRITVSFLDEGLHMVQVEGDPYPLGIFKETGWDLERLLGEAHSALVDDRNRAAGRIQGASVRDPLQGMG